jgi:uncharacterized protein YodC (DUF2158 family)
VREEGRGGGCTFDKTMADHVRNGLKTGMTKMAVPDGDISGAMCEENMVRCRWFQG